MRNSSFQCASLQLFNSLPKYIRNLINISIQKFKEHLDKFLTYIPDQPKVPELTPSCRTPEAVERLGKLGPEFTGFQ